MMEAGGSKEPCVLKAERYPWSQGSATHSTGNRDRRNHPSTLAEVRQYVLLTVRKDHGKLMSWISFSYERDMDVLEWLTVIVAGWGGAIALVLVVMWSRN